MTPAMTKIEQDDWLTDELMQRAKKLIADIEAFPSEGTLYFVSRALHLAEKRGEEREKERCFAEADKYTYASGVALRIAAAIRSGS